MSDNTIAGIGSDIPGYRIEELAGQGGMGVVYRAHDLRLKRTVALKLVAPRFARDARFRARFARETELAMALEHPNVVPIHDAGEFDGRVYLVMRYVEGTDLRSLLRAVGALEPRRALAIVAQIAHALDAAHEKGLVHRDVKPSNVLLDPSEHVYLADFGLTRRFADDGAQFADARSLGTPAYLAPEQIEGGAIDGRADVYSLGCLLYECLSGEPPFIGPSRLAVAWAHLEEEPPRVSARDRRLPEALDAVIAKAMEKEPEERYSTCAELVAAAEVALGLGRPRTRRTHALLLGAAVVGALSVVAAAVAVVFVGRGGDAKASRVPAGSERLVRIDPDTNAIARVIDVGAGPLATAVGGGRVWVYNQTDYTVSEIDPAANEVRYTTKISTVPTVAGPEVGPLLAADAEGAWLVGYDFESGRSLLTRIRREGRGKHEYRLELDPAAVAIGDGAVWVLAHRGSRNAALRIDPHSGRVTARVRLPDVKFSSGVDGLAVGDGFIWVTDSGAGELHRIDPKTGARRSRDFGPSVARPVLGLGAGWVWLCALGDSAGKMVRVDPQNLRNTLANEALPAEDGQYAVGYGSLWRHDVPSGTLIRFDPQTGDPEGLIRVLPGRLEARRGLGVTSIAAGAGGVWVTIGRV